MKVIDKIKNGLESNRVVFSFEFFPPKTEEGVENLYDRMDRMVAHQPAFCDITWGAGGTTSTLTLDIANKMQNMVCVCNPKFLSQMRYIWSIVEDFMWLLNILHMYKHTHTHTYTPMCMPRVKKFWLRNHWIQICNFRTFVIDILLMLSLVLE